MGERLAGGNVAIALLANTIATGAGLVALILTFGPISGAHFNAAVTLADPWQSGTPWRDVPTYLVAQVAGAIAGVAAAHAMFDEPLFTASTHVRAGASQAFSEIIATFGLPAGMGGRVEGNPHIGDGKGRGDDHTGPAAQANRRAAAKLGTSRRRAGDRRGRQVSQGRLALGQFCVVPDRA